MGPFQQYAEALIACGYTVIPIIPGSKKPGFFSNGGWIGLREWTKYRNGHISPQQERERWGKAGAGIGVMGGPPSQDMVGLDIDTEVPKIVAALLTVLPPTPVSKAGAKGETRFYHGPGLPSRSWSLNGKRMVEIIGPGRQTVLPPTIHPDTGEPYRWLGSRTLVDVRPQDLPSLPEDVSERIDEALTPFGYQSPPTRTTAGADDDEAPHRQLNNAGLANLPAWVPALKLYRCRPIRGGYEAVATWRPSSTGRPDRERQRNLKISPKGIRDFGVGVGYTPLDLIIAALGVDLDAAFAFLSEQLDWATPLAIEALLREGKEKNEAPGNSETSAATNGAGEGGHDADPTDAGADAAPAGRGEEANPLEPYTRIPGTLGDVVDWIVRTARRPNRVLALGAAIVTIGTLIGRRVAGPTRSATHLYVVTVAPATAGKDHPRRCILPMMDAARAGVHVHLGDITSQSGFNRMMKNTPLSVVVIDEIAGFLGRITSPRSSFWERRLSGKLREQWSCSFNAIGTMTSAEYDDTRIECPAMSMFGTSTGVDFWPIMQGSEIENGTFSRFLVLESNLHAPDQDPSAEPFKVPSSLGKRLAELYCWGGNPLAIAQLHDHTTRFEPNVLPWGDPAARDCYVDLTQWVERELEDDMSKQAYLGRMAETAIRLATIRAAGRYGRHAQIDLADMEWGAGLARIVITRMMEKSADCFVQTTRGEFVDRLIQIIQRHGSITRRKLQQHIRGRYRTQEVNDMLNQAIEAGLITRTAIGYQAVPQQK
jgi:Bifunctional DNA primase/polymerase, N-terminal/Protein of unknown function (DUF3987)